MPATSFAQCCSAMAARASSSPEDEHNANSSAELVRHRPVAGGKQASVVGLLYKSEVHTIRLVPDITPR